MVTDRRVRTAGALAVAVALSTSTLADALFGSQVPSLVAVVDQWIIRAAPGGLSRAAIDAVGTGDKPILVAMTVVAALLIGLWLGPAAQRRSAVGPLVLVGFGSLAVAAAASLDGVPLVGVCVAAALAVIAGSITLRFLLGLLAPKRRRVSTEGFPGEIPPDAPDDAIPALGLPRDRPGDRRSFLVAATAVTGSAALGLVGARQLGSPSVAAVQRTRVRLSTPAKNVATATGEPAVQGLSPFITPNAKFYRIDEALVVPTVDVSSWRLKFTGMVGAPFELTYEDLLGAPQIERIITLGCVSNEVGGKLVGTAKWSGVRLGDLLERAGVNPAATQVVGRSVDGFTAGFPVEAATDGRDALVALGMNGEPLPLTHGFPARLIVPGLYGFVSATKWLKEIELTTWEAFDAYWVERNWAERAPIKVQSRIDVPRDYSEARAGRVAVAGVAWSPRHGIAAAEVLIDGGEWQPTRLGPSAGDDAWRQWVYDWDASLGDHIIQVRAITADGELQTETKTGAFPNGASGRHEIHVSIVK